MLPFFIIKVIQLKIFEEIYYYYHPIWDIVTNVGLGGQGGSMHNANITPHCTWKHLVHVWYWRAFTKIKNWFEGLLREVRE